VAAELVVATPLLLLLLLGIIQFALWQHATHVADAVAQQGLAAGRLDGASANAGQIAARSVLDQLGTGVLVAPHISAERTLSTTTVTVTGTAEAVIPFLHLPVRAIAVGLTEHFTVASTAGFSTAGFSTARFSNAGFSTAGFSTAGFSTAGFSTAVSNTAGAAP